MEEDVKKQLDRIEKNTKEILDLLIVKEKKENDTRERMEKLMDTKFGEQTS